MKLSKQTVEILNNLSAINNQFVFREGTKVSSYSQNKSIAVEANISEVIPVKAATYELSKIMSCLSFLNDSEIFFNDNSIKISNHQSEAVFALADENKLTSITKDIKFDPSGIRFDLSWIVIKDVMKYANLMKPKSSSSHSVQNLTIEGNGEFIVARVQNSKKIDDECLTINLAQSDRKFIFRIFIDNLKFLEDDYSVEVAKATVVRFAGKSKCLTYYIAANDFSIDTENK